MSTEHVPVLIVGAGYAGLSTAMFLAQQGIRAVVVERHPDLSIHPRALGQTPRTVELLRTAGLQAELERLNDGRDSRIMLRIADYVGGRVFQEIVADEQLDHRTISPAPFLMLAQQELEPVLRDRAVALGAEVRLATELSWLGQGPDGVTARLRNHAEDSEYTVHADYLVAADGHRGEIRQQLGIGVRGPGELSNYVNILFDAEVESVDSSTGFLLTYLKNPTFSGAYGTVGHSGRQLLVVDYDPSRGESPADFTPERCVELIRVALRQPDLEPKLLGTEEWTMGAWVADTIRSGRVFLVGDSAKVTPPTGGHGGNTAIQDSFDLAWKLAAVLDGTAGPALLDSYDAERRPLAAAIASGPDDGSPTENVLEPSGRPGFRAPHVELRRRGELLSTVDLFAGRWVLLTGVAGGVWHAAAQTVAQRLGIPLDTHGLGPELLDVADELPRRYGIGDSGASLVRPDGVVAWRCDSEPDDPARTIERVLRSLLSR